MTSERYRSSNSYSNRNLIFLISVLMALIILDIYLVRINDIVNIDPIFDSQTREVVFGIISLGSLSAQFFLLNLVNPTRTDSQARTDPHRGFSHKAIANPIHKITKSVWYLMTALVLVIISQILVNSSYTTNLLSIIIIISHSLSIGILSLLVL